MYITIILYIYFGCIYVLGSATIFLLISESGYVCGVKSMVKVSDDCSKELFVGEHQGSVPSLHCD